MESRLETPPTPPSASEKKRGASISCLYVPVGEQEGADVGHRRGGGPELRQRHDVLEGDVGLSAHVHHVDLLRGAVGASAGGPPDDLHHDGFLGSVKGLHGLLMAGLGQLLPVHLRETTRPRLSSMIVIYLSCRLSLIVAIVTFFLVELFKWDLSAFRAKERSSGV